MNQDSKALKALIIAKSIDAGTGTYIAGLIKIGESEKLPIDFNVCVLEKPKYRNSFEKRVDYFSKQKKYPSRYYPSISGVVKFWRELNWFAKEVEQKNPDIVIASDSHAILLSEILKYFGRKNYSSISIIHNNLTKVFDLRLPFYVRPIVFSVFSYFLRKSDFVVSVSRYLSKYLYNEFNLKKLPVTVPSLLPQNIYKLANNKTSNSKFTISSVARFDKQKDQRTLIMAFAEVIKIHPNALLWLLGDGPMLNSCKKLVNSLGISQSVKFFGWVDNPAKIISKSDLFILSSFYEGFPLSLIEAMNLGLPVIASNCDFGPAEILGNNKYGVLVPVGNHLKMSKEILKLINKPDRLSELSELSLNRSKDFSNDNSFKKFIPLLGF